MNTTEQSCAAQHFGPWMIHPTWMSQAVAAIKAGTFKPKQQTEIKRAAEPVDPSLVGEWVGDVFMVHYVVDRGVAVIPFMGQVTKGFSSFGGASSVWARKSLRKAVSDDRVKAVLFKIDSPGGTVAGTGDLAGEIATADRRKPVYAYFEDLGASAAYWIGSQAREVYANPTAEIGSIGTMTVLEDTSGAYEKAGIKVILVATGKFKGQWVDGNPVSEEYVATVRTEIEDLNEHFLQGVMRGRRMSRDQLMPVADGRVFIAAKAKQLGLIDDVKSLDDTIAAISMSPVSARKAPMTPTEQVKSIAAEHPDAVAAYIEQGKKSGGAETRRSEAERLTAIEAACPGRPQLAIDLFKAGKDAEDAKITISALDAEAALTKAQADAHAEALAAKDKEIEKLRFESSGQKPIGSGKPSDRQSGPSTDGSQSPEETASAEWEANTGNCRNGFSSKANYVAVRKAELSGKLRSFSK